MQSRLSDFRELDAVVVAISADLQTDTAMMTERYGLEFPVLSDPEGRVIDAYGLRHPGGDPINEKDIARPATFLIGRDGRVLWRDLTENWRVRVRPGQLLDELRTLP